MRILGIERDTTACNHYRVLQPLLKLYQQGLAEVKTVFERDFIRPEFMYEQIMPADIILFQRPANEDWLKFIKTCRKAGKIIVCDNDDDIFNTSPMSPAYRYFGAKEVTVEWEGKEVNLWEHGKSGFDLERNIRRLELFKMSFKKADLITTTTDVLYDTYSKINPSCVVLPNLVDFSVYPKCEMVKREIRIGWQGGSSHYEDLYMIRKQLIDVLKNNDNVKFIYCGEMRFASLFNEIPDDKIEIHPWVSNVVYPYKLATLNLDIGLCPLVNNQFNISKSALKYFDYSVVKAATIASDIKPYSPVITNHKDGILVPDDGWKDAIEQLIKDKRKRNRLANNAYENIYQNYNADKKANLWYEAYDKVLKQELVTT